MTSEDRLPAKIVTIAVFLILCGIMETSQPFRCLLAGAERLLLILIAIHEDPREPPRNSCDSQEKHFDPLCALRG